MYARQIETNMRKLPPHIRSSVLDYVEFLVGKYGATKDGGKKFKFDWEGALADSSKQKFDEERETWALLSMHGLEGAYGKDEVEYSFDMIKKPNPEYEGR
jgi:Protein of unknown function (DUF2281)